MARRNGAIALLFWSGYLLIIGSSLVACGIFKDRHLSFGNLFLRRRLLSSSNRYLESTSPPLKILYIVTSIAEYDTGKRQTIEGRDRFAETMIPVITESVNSMLHSSSDGQHHEVKVDVYLIAHYSLSPARIKLLRGALPPLVNLEIWEEATPIGYPKANEDGDIDHAIEITRALARQHRYVIKDKLLDYDIFVNFEDDMLIHGEHIAQYKKVSQEIDRLRTEAPPRVPSHTRASVAEALDTFKGPMSKMQLTRIIPGFIRVERAANGTSFRKRTRPGRIPPEDSYMDKRSGIPKPLHIDPLPCCYRPGDASSPRPQDLFLWETHIRALGVRQMPSSSFLDWVVLQRGGSAYNMEAEMLIGDYWAGRDGDFVQGLPTDARPDSMESIYSNNQGGWMATREQIWNWHTRQCFGGFLPPFGGPMYPIDGMNHVVEYWSGGGNLYGPKACNLQRIIPLDPQEFSRHLVYHTSNNKQKQLKFVRGLFSEVDTMLGQLHTVKKRATGTSLVVAGD